MKFSIGQKVVCVDATRNPNGFSKFYPVEGRIYTIRGFHIEPHIEDVGILLEEVVNPPTEWADRTSCEWPFASKRFRPIVERKTDIGFADEILRKATEKVPA